MKDEEKTKEQLIEELNIARQEIIQLRDKQTIELSSSNSAVLEALSDMMFRLSSDGIFLDYYAPSYSPLYVPPSVFLGKRLEDVLPPHVVAISMKNLRKTLSSGERQVYEYYLDSKTEGRLYFEASMVVSGEHEILALVSDITERKQAQEKLNESEELHRIILSNISDAVFITDNNNQFTFICPNVSIIFGYSHDEVQALGNISQLLGDNLFVVEDLETLGEIANIERDIVDKNGEKHSLLINVKSVSIQDGTRLYSCRDITERKQAQEQLLASESRWRSLIENVPSILFEFDREGIIHFINRTAEGMEVEDVIGQNLFNFTPPDDHEQVRTYIEQVYQTGEAVSYETLGIDGEWYSVRIGAIKQNGEIGRLMMLLNNITELKKSEIALRQSEARFINYMENFPGGVFLKDAEQRLLYCNTNYAEMMGESPETIVGKSTTEYIHKADIHKPFYQQNQKVLQEGKAQIFENVYPTEDGMTYWETVKFPIHYPDGSPQLGAITLNVTERKLAVERLKKSEARLRSFIEAYPDIAFVINQESIIVDVLTAQEDLLYLDIEEIKGKPVHDVLPPDLAKRVSKTLQKTFRTKTIQSIEYELEVKAGIRWFEGRVALMPAIDSEDEFVVFVVRDITERRETEQRLSKSEEIIALKDTIITTVSHEFRTPLALIQTAGDLLTRYKDRLKEGRKEELFQQIRTQIRVMTELIEDMLSLSRIQSKNVEVMPSEIYLVQFCQSILDKVKANDTENHVFEFNVDNLRDETMNIDSHLLHHILMNLLTNALKFSPEGSHISLILKHDKNNLLIEVCDEGIGISDEDKIHLFEPFQRGSNVGTIRGTGLGLSIVKDYVELLGGSIAVESKVGKGSIFTVSLPLHQNG